jgi:hypothetical protein
MYKAALLYSCLEPKLVLSNQLMEVHYQEKLTEMISMA